MVGGAEGQGLIGYKLWNIADTTTSNLRRYVQHKTKSRVGGKDMRMLGTRQPHI
jgi:hypothetical protein